VDHVNTGNNKANRGPNTVALVGFITPIRPLAGTREPNICA